VLLVLAWSQVQSLVALYVLWAAIGVVSAAVLYQPAFAVVAVWFARRRAGAMTLLTLMAGWASIIFIPLAGWLVEVQGWRVALVTLAVILAVGTILPHALLLRRRPEDQGLAPDGVPLVSTPRQSVAMTQPPASWRTIVRDPTFRILTLAFALAGFAEGVLSVHLVPYLAESGGDGPSAATAAGLIGLAALGSRVVYAPFADRLPDTLVAAGVFALQAVSLLVLLVASGAFAVLAFVALYGFSRGLVSPTRASIVGTLYGRASYASIGGLLALFVVGAQSVAPVSAGVAFDLTARYEPIWLVLALISVLAALLVLRAGRRAPARDDRPQR
jgi:MFS family permease